MNGQDWRKSVNCNGQRGNQGQPGDRGLPDVLYSRAWLWMSLAKNRKPGRGSKCCKSIHKDYQHFVKTPLFFLESAITTYTLFQKRKENTISCL